ncbi:follistatin-related protein 3-like [Dysidea avara]|uniref:follistatin-related protein 3-like n=1 Tax=Dysidea avara TaxID=196820 RepID=UPI00332BA91A
MEIQGYIAMLPIVLLLTLGLSPVWQKHLTVSAQFKVDTDLCSTVHCPENYTCQQSQHKEGGALIATCAHRCNFTCPTAAYEVCGTDNETYLNPCLFTKKRCYRGQAVYVLHFGYCGIYEGAPNIIPCKFDLCVV